jgi:hypothetical protein
MNTRNRLVVFVVVIAAAVAAAGWWLWRGSDSADDTAARDGVPRSSSVRVTAEEVQPLVGRWRRTDGGYVIEIRGLGDDGYLDAAYYNPRPINVSQARVVRSPRGLHVFVELWDRGYPGATYRLDHDAEAERLAGVYHQPALNQSFDVIFVRAE